MARGRPAARSPSKHPLSSRQRVLACVSGPSMPRVATPRSRHGATGMSRRKRSESHLESASYRRESNQWSMTAPALSVFE